MKRPLLGTLTRARTRPARGLRSETTGTKQIESTASMHRDENATHASTAFARSKQRLDPEWHRPYRHERQLLHDNIIRHFIPKLERGREPWILFTAGAMGAGKTRTMQWLGQHGYFPLAKFAHINPDTIKRYLPEYDQFLREDPENLGHRLREEAGFLAESIFWECTFRSFNIWYDTSLRHDTFFVDLISRVRQDFPQYRIAVIHVKARPEQIMQRARLRAVKTGRVVPESALRSSLDSVGPAVDRLCAAGNLDLRVTLDNSTDFDPESEECAEDFAKEFTETNRGALRLLTMLLSGDQGGGKPTGVANQKPQE